jgi:hypothetical protein
VQGHLIFISKKTTSIKKILAHGMAKNPPMGEDFGSFWVILGEKDPLRS